MGGNIKYLYRPVETNSLETAEYVAMKMCALHTGEYLFCPLVVGPAG